MLNSNNIIISVAVLNIWVSSSNTSYIGEADK